MTNKKVYLAKSNDASGSDVEYVRSNLLRIPGLELVEYVSGINSDECSCVVIVPSKNFAKDEFVDGYTCLGKNVGTVLNDFLESNSVDISKVFIYYKKFKSYGNDVEPDLPSVFECHLFDVINENDFESYSDIEFYSEDPICLLSVISKVLNDQSNDYKNNKRHFSPLGKYCLPNLPDFETRRLNRVTVREVEKPTNNRVLSTNYPSINNKIVSRRERRNKKN